jgi:hypothetical protein
MEMDIEDVPDFCEKHGADWFGPFQEWLGERGLAPLQLPPPWKPMWTRSLKDVPVLAGVPHSGVIHEVVYMNGKIHYDPATDDVKSLGPAKYFILLVPKNPASFSTQ